MYLDLEEEATISSNMPKNFTNMVLYPEDCNVKCICRYTVMIFYDADAGYYGISDIVTLSGLVDNPTTPITVEYDNDGDYGISATLRPTIVPEATSVVLLGLGMVALALRRRRA